jgi:hypothetical protein
VRHILAATGEVHLRVRSWICVSRLCAAHPCAAHPTVRPRAVRPRAPIMAATVDTAQRHPATAGRTVPLVMVAGVPRLTELAAGDVRTAAAVEAEHARTAVAEVVDILVAEAAMQEVAAAPAAATANDRDKDLDVSSKLCH